MAVDEDRYIEYAIADLLYQARCSLSLTQRDIAAELGTSHESVHYWETGLQFPGTLMRLKAWAVAVNCRQELVLVDQEGKRHSF